MIRKAGLYFLFLIACCPVVFCQVDSIDAEPPVILPFPAKHGWTFVSDTDSVAFPVYDSIVMASEPLFVPLYKPNSSYEESTWAASFIARDSTGKYGLIACAGLQIDTLQSFRFDSIFQVHSVFFGKENGLWYNWEFSYARNNSPQLIGTVDKWLLLDDHLYYSASGKTGVFTGAGRMQQEYSFIHFYFSDYERLSRNTVTEISYYLVSDGQRFGLVSYRRETGWKEVIPVVAKSIQWHKHGFYRYWEGYWKYLRLKDGLLIDPQGGDLVIYNNDSWKVYNKERTRSVCYLRSGASILSGNYEDYFLLSDNTIAVRKDSLVGLLNASGTVLFGCRYEQIEALHPGYYRCLKEKHWYLVDGKGKVLNTTGFDFIVENRGNEYWFGSESQPEQINGFFVHQAGKMGVIGLDGRLILPTVYDAIFDFTTVFILDQNRKLAIADRHGKVLSPFMYLDYDMHDGMVAMRETVHKKDLYSEFGKLNRLPCDVFLQSDGVIKCYSPGFLEVIVLDDDSVKVSERLNYPNVSSFVVGEQPEVYELRYHGAGRIVSHLEEHQLSSRFGYRKDWSAGHIHPPDFREVDDDGNFSYDFGIREYEETQLLPGDGLSFVPQFSLQAVEPGAGEYAGIPFFSSTIRNEVSGGSTSANRISYTGGEKRAWWSGVSGHLHSAGEVVYIDYPADDLYEYNIGGKLVVTTDGDGRIPLFDYYNNLNSSQNLAIDPAMIPAIMDPASQLKVEGGQWFVDIDYSNRPELIVGGLKKQYYDELLFQSDAGSGRDKYVGKPSGAKAFTWSYTKSDSIVRQIRSIEGGDYYTVTGMEMMTGLVHPYHPSYVFVPADSNTFYANGRLVARTDGFWGLKSVDEQELLPPVYDRISYLGNGLFGLEQENQWQLADRNGNSPSQNRYELVGAFEKGYAVAKTDKGWLVIDTQQQTVFRSENKEIRNGGDGFFTISDPERTIVFDPLNNRTDTILKAEKNLGSGWIYGKIKGQPYVRRFGSSRRIAVKATGVPEVFGSSLIVNRNGIYTMLDPEGHAVLPKTIKPADFEKGGELICFKTPKKWVFVSADGKIRHESPKGKSLNYFDRMFVIELKDSTYAIDAFGNTYELDEGGRIRNTARPTTDPGTQKAGEHILFVDGKQGVGSDEGKLLVDPVHTAVIGKSGEEYLVQVSSKQGVYNELLEELVPPVYDEVFVYDARFILVRQGKSYGILTASGEWFKPLTAF